MCISLASNYVSASRKQDARLKVYTELKIQVSVLGYDALE